MQKQISLRFRSVRKIAQKPIWWFAKVQTVERKSSSIASTIQKINFACIGTVNQYIYSKCNGCTDCVPAPLSNKPKANLNKSYLVLAATCISKLSSFLLDNLHNRLGFPPPTSSPGWTETKLKVLSSPVSKRNKILGFKPRKIFWRNSKCSSHNTSLFSSLSFPWMFLWTAG